MAKKKTETKKQRMRRACSESIAAMKAYWADPTADNKRLMKNAGERFGRLCRIGQGKKR